MAKIETFIISRQELRRVLIAFGISEKNIEALLSSMEKAHRHMNAIVFAGLLEKTGLDRDKEINVLRRVGLDDLTIRNIINMSDQQRVISETGRLFEITVEW